MPRTNGNVISRNGVMLDNVVFSIIKLERNVPRKEKETQKTSVQYNTYLSNTVRNRRQNGAKNNSETKLWTHLKQKEAA